MTLGIVLACGAVALVLVLLSWLAERRLQELANPYLVDDPAKLPNVDVGTFRGLLVDYCRDHAIGAIVKGLRAVSDFDYELQMAQMNWGLSGPDKIATLFMPTSPEFSFISSSLVKQVATYGGDVSAHLPPAVFAALAQRLSPQPD